ncbi:S41 family peptidase [Flavobacterium frigoris]|uniref:Carboxyl-terminal processing protease n=1 Tax=Flavobacterium frigoris TaxID=229204 RepID=A0A1H9HRH6_FLAFI|nr:S41 family peptidase [Flavobacterium frigoris]SEQ64905.1 carboxyl-terminal processing protease [Flavobacterium frigoris]
MKIISLVFLLTSFSLFAQSDTKTCVLLSKMNTLIQSEHIQPKPIDDSLSIFVFDNFIDALDPSRNILLKSEYEVLSHKYRLELDDLIHANDCSFLSDIVTVYKAALMRNRVILEKMKNDTIGYNVKDTIRFYKKAFPFYLEENQVEKALRKKIKYEILDDIVSQNNNLDTISASFNILEAVSKNLIIANEICKINVVLQKESGFEENLLDNFCSYFDPHTAYFNVDTKSSFVASLSKEQLSLGMNVSLNDRNEIIIIKMNPNGPAFQTGGIKKGDQIIAVSNLKETLQVSCVTLESISNMILSDSNKKILLTLRRNSGKNFEVLVEKKRLKDDANVVYSFIIANNKRNYGYVKIPSFYSDFEGNSGKGCADDTALEVLKLQKDSIQGVIIDLIDNGGGSIEEAIKLAGMFIDTGPVSIFLDNKKAQTIVNDPYPGMIYKDPIVILINGNSASASEFFASALQDYNRALLMGGATLGKATMQSIVPLEPNDAENFVKISTHKFYRITGKSNQAIGIIPNVLVPEIYESIYSKECNNPTAFINDSIVANLVYKEYLKNSVIAKIVKKSNDRIAVNSNFNEAKKINKKIDALIKTPKLPRPVTIDTIIKDQSEINAMWKEITAFDTKSNNLFIHNSKLNNYLLTINPSERANNEFQLEELKKSHYLNEAIAIINDLNSAKK